MIPGLVTRLSEEVIASATTIAPQSDLILVSGTTSVATITPPSAFGGRTGGMLIVVATDTAGFATVTTGNIALAVALTTGKAVLFAYSAKYTKWYPGAIS